MAVLRLPHSALPHRHRPLAAAARARNRIDSTAFGRSIDAVPKEQSGGANECLASADHQVGVLRAMLAEPSRALLRLANRSTVEPLSKQASMRAMAAGAERPERRVCCVSRRGLAAEGFAGDRPGTAAESNQTACGRRAQSRCRCGRRAGEGLPLQRSLVTGRLHGRALRSGAAQRTSMSAVAGVSVWQRHAAADRFPSGSLRTIGRCAA